MALRSYGGGTEDFYEDELGHRLTGTGTVWTAQTGGTQIVAGITDPNGGTGGNVKTATSPKGQVQFQITDGPDFVYADFGGGRVRLEAWDAYVTTAVASGTYPSVVAASAAFGDGATDATAHIQSKIDLLGGNPGTIWLPVSVGAYMLTAPLVLHNGQNLVGAGISIGVGGGSNDTVCLRAKAGFAGAAMVKSYSWDNGGWWHWGSVQNMRIDADGNAAACIAIHQMGENSVLERVFVKGATDSNIILTGAHAPATLRHVSSNNATNYGLKLTVHPSTYAADGNSGVAYLDGYSGDNHGVAHLYGDGSHQIEMRGWKSERCPVGIVIAGSGTGGAATTLTVSGKINAAGIGSPTDVIKIQGTAQPFIDYSGLRQTGYTNMINDTVLTRAIVVGSPFSNQPTSGFYSGTVFMDAEFVLGRGREIKVLRTDNGNLFPVLYQQTDLSMRLKGVSGPGWQIRDSSDNLLLEAGSTNKVKLSTAMTLSRTASTLAANGAVTIDSSLGNTFTVTLQANATSSSITNPVTGRQITITWLQDGTGGRTYAWPANCKFAGGTAPADTTLNKRSTVTFEYDGTNWNEISRAVAVG